MDENTVRFREDNDRCYTKVYKKAQEPRAPALFKIKSIYSQKI